MAKKSPPSAGASKDVAKKAPNIAKIKAVVKSHLAKDESVAHPDEGNLPKLKKGGRACKTGGKVTVFKGDC
jgi:hypothetical protein